jgi:hypothetical protein
MKARIGLVLIMVAAFFLLGMGKMGQSDKPGEIPMPDQEVTAVIADKEGVTLNLTQFSINGKTYLQGRLGAGVVAIPFSRIRVMTPSAESKETSVRIDLTDGSHLNLVLEKGLTAYGKFKAGTYQILLDNLKRIEIQSVAERKKEKDRP